jgi:CDP-paratose 2-epimerase
MFDRVLVTGGAGFIGSHVAERMVREGREVVVLDNLSRAKLFPSVVGSPGATYNWDYLLGLGSVEMVRGDVRDEELVRRLVMDVDAVVHCAAQVAVTFSLRNPRLDMETNVMGTFNVLEAARRSPMDPAVIVCSTNKVYGGNVNAIPLVEEETRCRYADPRWSRGIPESLAVDGGGHTPYGVSKLAADLYAQDYGRTLGLRVGVLRMSCIFGPRQFGNEEQGWVAHFLLSALHNRPITIYGDGKQVRDLLFVDDLMGCMEAYVARASNLRGEVFNVGGGPENAVSLLDFIGLLEGAIGRRPVVAFGPERPGDQKVYISDVTKAKDLLGWRPRVAPRKGLQRFLEWWASAAPTLPEGAAARRT